MTDWLKKHYSKVFRRGQKAPHATEESYNQWGMTTDDVLTLEEPKLYKETHVYRVWIDPQDKSLVSINARSKPEAQTIFERRQPGGMAWEYIGELNDVLDPEEVEATDDKNAFAEREEDQ